MRIKNYFAVILVLTMIISIAAPITMADGNIIHIKTAEDIITLAKNCSLDSYSTGKKVILDNSISMAGVTFNYISYFNGIFEGNGYTISDFNPQSNGGHQGFFRYIGSAGEIKNLNIKGNVIPDGSRTQIGGIAGTNNGIITGCSFEGTVKGLTDVGMIAGENYGTIRNCFSRGQATGKQFTGGIVGYNKGFIVNCTNYAKVNTTITESAIEIESLNVSSITNLDLISSKDSDTVSDTGGIAGASTGSIIGCTNEGEIGYQHYGYNIGGIAGRQSGYIKDCENKGKVHGKQDIGGIVGQMEPFMQLAGTATLANELNILKEMVSAALGDSNVQTNDVTNVLNDIQGDVANASNNANSLLLNVGTFIDNTVDTTNEILSRVHYVINAMQPITHNFNIAAQDFSQGMYHLDVCMDNIELDEETAAELHIYMNDLATALGRISDELTYLSYVASAYYNKKGDGDVNLDEVKPSPEEQQRIEEEYGYNFDLDGASSSKLKNAILQCLSDLITDTAKAQRAKTEIVRLLDEYYFTNIYDEDGDGVPDTCRADKARDEGQVAREYFLEASEYLALATEGLDQMNTYLAEQDEIQYQNLGSGYYSATNGLFSSINSMTGNMSELNDSVAVTSDVLTVDLTLINNQFIKVLTLMANAINGQADITILEDISDEEPADSTDGKVISCVNYTEIDGDTNVGGIAGSMGKEYDFDMEGTIKETLGVEGIFSSTYQTKCVVNSCINRGPITAKKDNAGGIVGRSEVGTIVETEGYGNVSSTNGGYVGGIVGNSDSTVRSSYAMCNVSGMSYVGGIAGKGTKIVSCSSLIGISDVTECAGAIAGYADLSETGNVTDNVFVQEKVGAIDGISYIGIAEPVSYDVLASGENVPAEFGDLKLTFTVDGKKVKTVSFKYGEAISKSEIPEVPSKEGYSGSWPDYDYSSVFYSDTLEAIYTSNQATMATEQTRDDSPLSIVLVEGNFNEDAKVLVNEFEGTGPDIDETKDEVVEQWVLRIEDGEDYGKEGYTVRYLTPKTEKNQSVSIYAYRNGGWEPVDTKTSGSYKVFDSEGTTVFAAVATKQDNSKWFIIGGAAALIVLIIIVIIISSKKKTKKAKHAKPVTE